MAYRADLSEGQEDIDGALRPVRYVGWLDETHPFTKGHTPEPFRTRLFELCRNPINQMLRFHECPFCERYVSGAKDAQTISGVATGNGEIHVAAPDGTRYVAPDLIAHYVAVHGYKPPDQFVAAVLGDQHQAQRRVWDRVRLFVYSGGAFLLCVVIVIGLACAIQDAQQLAVEGKPAAAITVAEARVGGRRWLAAKLLGRYKQEVAVDGLSMTLMVSEPMPIGTVIPVLHIPGNPRLIVVGQPGDEPLVLYQRAMGLGFTAMGVIAALTCLLFSLRWLIAGLKRSDE